jgi:hypothetical protein
VSLSALILLAIAGDIILALAVAAFIKAGRG